MLPIDMKTFEKNKKNNHWLLVKILHVQRNSSVSEQRRGLSEQKEHLQWTVVTVALTVGRPSSSCCAACGAGPGRTAASWGSAASGRSASPGCLRTRCGTGWSLGPIRPPCSSGSCSWNAERVVNKHNQNWSASPFLPVGCSVPPEGVGAQGRLIVAGQSAGPLVPRHHVLQRGLLDHVEADAQTGSALHVVDVLRLEDSVDRQALQVQLNTHCERQKDGREQTQFRAGSGVRWDEVDLWCRVTCGVAALVIDLHWALLVTFHDKAAVVRLLSSEVGPGGGRQP